jgi:hypothetical protein
VDYSLGVVEFDDEGWAWDPSQLQNILGYLKQRAKTQNLLIVTFVHGWKHNASFDDPNVQLIRKNLEAIAELVNELERNVPRHVVGVYVGWRGLSVDAWGARELSFWDRKNTAHEVGRGGVTELLARLDAFRNDRRSEQTGMGGMPTQLVIVGHSFGGAVTYSALAPILMERFVQDADGTSREKHVRTVGDLVVLINPAFEAARFRPLLDIATGESWRDSQQPVTLAIFTSKEDDATRKAFPLGRFFSTFWHKHRDDEQKASTRQAVGHYQPFITHDLLPSQEPEKSSLSMSARFDRLQEQRASNDKILTFSTVKLERRPGRDPRMPLYVVSVDGTIVPDHNTIDRPAFVTFLQEFLLLSMREQAEVTRGSSSPWSSAPAARPSRPGRAASTTWSPAGSPPRSGP